MPKCFNVHNVSSLGEHLKFIAFVKSLGCQFASLGELVFVIFQVYQKLNFIQGANLPRMV